MTASSHPAEHPPVHTGCPRSCSAPALVLNSCPLRWYCNYEMSKYTPTIPANMFNGHYSQNCSLNIYVVHVTWCDIRLRSTVMHLTSFDTCLTSDRRVVLCGHVKSCCCSGLHSVHGLERSCQPGQAASKLFRWNLQGPWNQPWRSMAQLRSGAQWTMYSWQRSRNTMEHLKAVRLDVRWCQLMSNVNQKFCRPCPWCICIIHIFHIEELPK